MPEPISPAAIPSFLWKVEDIGVSVAISRAVLDEVRAGLDLSPEGAEFGGILLGRLAAHGDGFHTQVEAFEAFPIEHRYGASYALSPRDERLLERRLQHLRRKGLAPVGFCRSHQRRGLYLDQRDFDLFKNDFRHPASIFLLARREDADGAKGAIFVWEEDDIRRHASYLEFPIGKPLAASGQVYARMAERRWGPGEGPLPNGRGSVSEGALGLVPPPLLTSAARLGVTPSTAAKVLLSVALPLLSFYTAREIAFHRARRSAIDLVRPAPQPASVPSHQVDRDVAPSVEPKPNPFSDPASPVAQARQTVLLPPVEGKPAVTSDSRDRDEADTADSTAAESRSPRPDTAPARVVPVLPDPPSVVPERPAASLPRIVASPPVAGDRAPERVAAYFIPEPPSSIRRAFQKVLTGHATEDEFVAANPVEYPLPSPPLDAVALEKGTSIEMLTKVDRHGNVVYIKVVDGNRQLADASAHALLRWRFDPARRNGAPVDSSMRIRFEFPKSSR